MELCRRCARFERELEALRKELADATARSGRSSPTSLGSEEDLAVGGSHGSPIMMTKGLAPKSTTDNVSPALGVEDKKTQ